MGENISFRHQTHLWIVVESLAGAAWKGWKGLEAVIVKQTKSNGFVSETQNVENIYKMSGGSGKAMLQNLVCPVFTSLRSSVQPSTGSARGFFGPPGKWDPFSEVTIFERTAPSMEKVWSRGPSPRQVFTNIAKSSPAMGGPTSLICLSGILVCPFSETTHELDMSLQNTEGTKMLNGMEDHQQ